MYPRLSSQSVEVFDENGDTHNEYLPSLSCYFKINVSEGKRVRIKFDRFDFQAGVNSGIIINPPGNTTTINIIILIISFFSALISLIIMHDGINMQVVNSKSSLHVFLVAFMHYQICRVGWTFLEKLIRFAA